jgi:uncharacterized protein
MAKKKTTRSTKRKKTTSKKNAWLKQHLTKIGLSLAILVLVVTAAGILTHRLLDRETPEKRPVPIKKIPATKGPVKKVPPEIKTLEQVPAVIIPTYEVYPKEVITPPSPIVKSKAIPGRNLPEVAIIIDDIGYDIALAEKFIRLNSSLTFSLLPFGPFNDRILSLAREKDLETMLHLPMEPREYPKIKPGPGALYTSMTPDSLIAQLEADLNVVPDIKGVNNHMGSKMTESSDQMNQIFTILKKRGLYFVDSKTTPDSLCKSSARLFRVPFAERDVFIDHFQDREFIRKQIDLLIRIAQKYGSSIGIAHPHEVTYEVLDEMMPELKKKVTIVPVSRLVEKPI